MTGGRGALQIHTAEPVAPGVVECVVRCVGGLVRVGQRYEAGRFTVDWIKSYGRRVDQIPPPYSAKVQLSGAGVEELRDRVVILADDPRSYGYAGPREIWRAVRGAEGGRAVGSAADFEAWVSEQEQADLAEPFTYVIDVQGLLWLAPRRSEHVACAGRGQVLGAGEVAFRRAGGAWEVDEISNQSTGYCPDLDSWAAVAAALDRAGLGRPDGFTHEVLFRRCPGCGEVNVVREGWFVCALCGDDLPADWNL
ncbi:hypothetical protein [Streptomyces sp. NPDC002187]|uniref:hypothetical protein n=1 Tax=Streptomyces sp. NPDC002187 TaxID=3364637 RepID=UPI0036914B86